MEPYGLHILKLKVRRFYMSEQLAIEMIDVTKIYPNGVVANRMLILE